jgi:hypothetical protein
VLNVWRVALDCQLDLSEGIMGINDMASLSSALDYMIPVEKESSGGSILRKSLKGGSAEAVMQLIKSMDARGVAAALRDAGFLVDQSIVERGRAAVFSSVKSDLNEALSLLVDGFGLRHLRAQVAADVLPEPTFAAKDNASEVALGFTPEEFGGDMDAARMIQKTFRFNSVAIDLLGDALPSSRGALLMIAAQGLKNGIQGFGFDGVAGKYQVSLGMAELVDLHRDAAQAVAIQTARAGLGVWAAGGRVKELDGWVPDSVQRLLHGSVSLESAQAVVQAIEDGSVLGHAGQIGTHEFTALLAAQGLDVNAKTVAQMASESGWVVQALDRMRGHYFGPVVAVDHRAGLVKHTRVDVIELPFTELAEGQNRPNTGDMVRLDFKQGTLTMNVLNRPGREGIGR